MTYHLKPTVTHQLMDTLTIVPDAPNCIDAATREIPSITIRVAEGLGLYPTAEASLGPELLLDFAPHI